MPPVILFNKEWRIGSDDFVFSAVLEVLLRVGSTVTLGLILGFHMQELAQLECMGKEYRYTTGYLIVALVLQILCAVNLCLLGKSSSQGRMFDPGVPHPRRHVSTHLYVNCALTAAEFVITACGTYFVIKDFLKCSAEDSFRFAVVFVIVIIILTYLLLAIKFICVVTAFKPFSKKIASTGESEREPLSKELRLKNESMLTYRGLRCLMPWSNDEGTLEAFKEISLMLAKTFHDDEMVPSDIVAGLLLLHYKHSLAKDSKKNNIQPILSRDVDLSADIEELKYFYKYSLAAYGCWWYIIDAPCAHSCALGAYMHWCPCFPCMRDQRQIVEGDSCFNMNLAAAKALLNTNEDEFIIFDNRNKIQEVPYFVAVDHEKKCIVISIRGTLSIADMFTDLRAESCALSSGFPEDVAIDPKLQGHKGMVHAARYIYSRLHGLPVSDEDRKKERQDRVNILSLTLAEFQNYSIVVTGHSLGAGTASILSFILREKYKDREVKCFAFSPPGGLLSPAAAEESLKFTVTLVTGDDVIPRLSLPNIAKLADEIRKVTEQCTLPKYKLFSHGLVSFLCCVKSATIQEELQKMNLDIDGVGGQCGAHGGDKDPEGAKEVVSKLDGHRRSIDLINLSSPSAGGSVPTAAINQQPLPSSSSNNLQQQILIEVQEQTVTSEHADVSSTNNTHNLMKKVADGCTELEKTAGQFEQIEKVVTDKFQSEPSQSEDDKMPHCDEGLPVESLLSKATEQIIPLKMTDSLYPPGRIVYLEETEEGDCQVFRPDRFHFKQILVSPRMLRDHLPNYLDRLIQKL
eukprot:TRINITY_DN19458_c0_g1_i3.p1 TRINITY_DN19458_c0_g1~~TRINITY_DN19458_c0_g1_i3.p1  ORF type:complete len:801 (-),score=133.21 TRINITY_DN19458_c0_g1_i3:263-2665(-)